MLVTVSGPCMKILSEPPSGYMFDIKAFVQAKKVLSKPAQNLTMGYYKQLWITCEN